MFYTKYIIISILSAVGLVGIVSGVIYFGNKPMGQVACTQEAKLCPDGSYVGRQGPNCEFAECPNAVEIGIVSGKVSIGPICPVEREGMPCLVPPEDYTSREVILYATDGITIMKRMNFLPDGTYSFQVQPGTYVLNISKQGIDHSSELPKTITLKSGETIEVNFSIDTGIR